MKDALSPSSPEDEFMQRVTIADIFRLLMNGRYVTLCVIAIFVALALFVSLTSPKVYRATYIVAPADNSSDALRGMLSQIPLFSSSHTESPDFTTYTSLLFSERVAERIAARHDLVEKIFPGGLKLSGPDNAHKALSLAIAGYLNRNLSLTETKFASEYAVVIDSTDPALALELLKIVHSEANNIVRETRLRRGQLERAHLMEQLNQTTVADYRTMLLQLLSRVENQIMTSSMPGDFAAVIVDGPYVLPGPVFPRPMLFLELAVIGGVVVGFLLVVFTPLSDDILRRLAARLVVLARTSKPWRLITARMTF